MNSIYEKLSDYSSEDVYPFHMPGHKRNAEFIGEEASCLKDMYSIDITEIEGFDNLHDASGLIKFAEERASSLYGSLYTHFLVNGSTCGILSAISSVSKRGDTIIIGRNCHKSVYHGIYLNGLKVRYLYPEYDEEYEILTKISPEDVKEEIENAEKSGERICAVLITSPSYDGISSHVKRIAEISHEYEIPLIVDAAHGAHFGFNDNFPENAVKQGADIVIHSVHKTMMAPTQTALLHVCTKRIDDEKIKKYLGIYETSSPSYPLMAGIDYSIAFMKSSGRNALQRVYENSERVKSELKDLRHIKIYPYSEPGKLVILIKNKAMTGRELADILRERYKLEFEMAQGNYILAMLTQGDKQEGILRLIRALKETDEELVDGKKTSLPFLGNERPKEGMAFFEAFDGDSVIVDIEKATGRMAADFINLYPPGAPLVVPGEVISKELIVKILSYLENGYEFSGIKDNKVKVLI